MDSDGIVNCDVADGSEAAPYVIRGWSISQTTGVCTPTIGLCAVPAPCSQTAISAALAVCNTTKHLRIEDVYVENRQGVRDVSASVGTTRDSPPAAAILLFGAANVEVRRANLTAAGVALAIRDSPTSSHTPFAIRVQDVVAGEVRSAEAPSVRSFGLVEIAGADVDIARLHVTENERDAVVRLDGLQSDTTRRVVRMADSSIESGTTTTFGLRASVYDTIVTGSTFGAAGYNVGSFSIDGSTTVQLFRGNHAWFNNRLEVENVGLRLIGAGGRMHHNDFQKVATQEAAGIHQDQICATMRITYNDLAGLAAHNQVGCLLRLPNNYWGPQPQSTGSVDRDPVLRVPPSDLPTLTIHSPGPGQSVHGKFIVHGTAEPGAAGALKRVEATALEDAWTTNVTADGTETWQLSWDATAHPIGPFSLWVRACAELGCGSPSELQLTIVERPLPPIALLDALPRVAHPGDIVTLDARASYSPQARPISLYRFDLGNGVRSDWIPTPTYEVRYTTIGHFPTSVEVIDAAGLQNNNLPQAVVRVRADPQLDGAYSRIPGTATIMVLAALAAAAITLRSRP